MKNTVVLLLALVLLVPAAAWAADDEPAFEELLDEVMAGLSAENIPDRRDSQQRLQERCFALGAPGVGWGRAEACRLMASRLSEDVPVPARVWLLKQLQHIGKSECVEAIAGLLTDGDRLIREAALRALTDNPSEDADDALRDALEAATTAEDRVALANALGYRGEDDGVSALAALLSDNDDGVASAVAVAIARIGGSKAKRALSSALHDDSSDITVVRAYLRLADGILEDGEAREARGMYDRLYALDLPASLSMAALRGRIQAAGNRRAELVAELLGHGDFGGSAVAALLVGREPDDDVIEAIREAFAELPPVSQARALSALVTVGDTEALPLALRAVQSEDEMVWQAGLAAVGALGDRSVVPLLLDLALDGDARRDRARESLRLLSAEGADDVIVEAMRAAEPDRRSALIDILRERRAVATVPALLEEARSEDDGVRKAAVRALGELAEPGQAAEMVGLLRGCDDVGECRALEDAIARVLKQTQEADDRAEPVLALLDDAAGAELVSLLAILGRTGGTPALEALREALADGTEEAKSAAKDALCNWPDAAAADDLFELAGGHEDESIRLRALRAYVRVIEHVDPGKRVGLCKKAMAVATDDKDRGSILRRAGGARSLEALEWIVEHLDRPALVNDAGRALLDVARDRNLAREHRGVFEAALTRVIESSGNAGLVRDATQRLEEL